MSDQDTTPSATATFQPAAWRGRTVTVAAKYAGQCPTCGREWKPGDLIRRLSDPFSRYMIWGHDTCSRGGEHGE